MEKLLRKRGKILTMFKTEENSIKHSFSLKKIKSFSVAIFKLVTLPKILTIGPSKLLLYKVPTLSILIIKIYLIKSI